MGKGVLVLVVGPSGAGKDTLISAAREALSADPRFIFPRRVVTRDAVVALEDHDSLTPAEFQLQKLRGAFALDWQAHGLSYGVPASIEADLAQGRVIIVNTSRRVIEVALEKYAECAVLLVTARPEVRALRLASRGRETAEDVALRLAREGAPVPAGVSPIVIDNSESLAEGIAAFVGALQGLAA